MYLSSASPILPGDRERAAREECRSSRRRDAAALQSVMGRLELWQTITTPADLAQMFGPQLGANALMMQNDTVDARQDAVLGPGIGAAVSTPATLAAQQAATPTLQQIIASAPRSYSLNGQPSQVNGCTWEPSPPIPLPPSPTPTMPPPGPVLIQTPIGPASIDPGKPPRYSNLCWALHNGLITQDQFNPVDYARLYQGCANLGYTQGCAPPTEVATWIIRNRAAGTLPRLTFSDADLAAIPHAPDMTNMGCAQAAIAGGLTGYAPPWSDALVTDYQTDTSSPDTGVGGWIADHPWLSLAIGVGAAVALSRRVR